MKYAYIIEGKIGRIKNNNLEIMGLCTDNISSCNIIVLISTNNNRYSLIHANNNLNIHRMVEEIKWVNEEGGVNCFILRRTQSGYKSQPSYILKNKIVKSIKKYLSNIKEIFITGNEEAVTVAVGDEKPNTKCEMPENVIYHPKSALLYTRNGVEGLTEEGDEDNKFLDPLFFNGSTWTEYSDISLSEATQDWLQIHKLTPDIAACEIRQKLLYYNPSEESEFTDHRAAKICLYFYLHTTQSPSFEGFLNECFTIFKNRVSCSNRVYETIEHLKTKLDLLNYFDNSPLHNPKSPLSGQILIMLYAYDIMMSMNIPFKNIKSNDNTLEAFETIPYERGNSLQRPPLSSLKTLCFQTLWKSKVEALPDKHQEQTVSGGLKEEYNSYLLNRS